MGLTPLDRNDRPYRSASSDRGGSTAPYTLPDTDPFDAWTIQKGYASASRLRLPAVLASSRLKLSSRRCDELQAGIDDLKDRLLNRSRVMPFEHVSELERRLIQQENALHAERLTAWRDLLPLLRESKDAAIEDLRTSFLNEFTRLIGESQDDTGGGGGRPPR